MSALTTRAPAFPTHPGLEVVELDGRQIGSIRPVAGRWQACLGKGARAFVLARLETREAVLALLGRADGLRDVALRAMDYRTSEAVSVRLSEVRSLSVSKPVGLRNLHSPHCVVATLPSGRLALLPPAGQETPEVTALVTELHRSVQWGNP